MLKAYIESPLGMLEIISSGSGVTNVKFVRKKKESSYDKILVESEKQLREYFSGKRKNFDLPLDLSGSKFQEKVWGALRRIPYGETKSYKQISKIVRSEGASRAVGNANKKNCLPIIIPCHRVISSGGGLGGYSAGLWRKKWLLVHEAKHKFL